METQGEDNHLQAKERGQEQTLPSEPSEGANPADTWSSDFQPPELGDDKFLLFKLLSLQNFIMATLAN